MFLAEQFWHIACNSELFGFVLFLLTISVCAIPYVFFNYALVLSVQLFTLQRCVYLKTFRHRDILTHLDIFALLTQSQWPRPFVKHGVSPARSPPTYPNFKTELVYASSSSEAEQRIPKAFLLSFFTFPS